MGPCIRFAACVMVLGGTAALRADDDGPERLAVINVAIPAKDDNQLGALAISPDGKTLAVGVTRSNFGVQGKVRLYSLPRGKHIRTLEGNPGVVADIAFARDGKSLAASIGGTVQRFEVESGKELAVLRPSRQGPVSQLRFSADGKKLAGIADRIHVVAWDVARGQEIGCHEPKVGREPTPITALYLTADGDTATVLHGGRAQRLDLASGKCQVVSTSYRTLTTLVASPDGKHIFGHLHAADHQSSIVEWDLQIGKEVEFATCPQPPGQLAVSSDGRRVVGTFGDGTVRVWDRVARQQVAAFQAHRKVAYWLALSPDGKTLATGGKDELVQIWDLTSVPEAEKPVAREKPKPVDTPPPTKEGAELAAKAHKVLKSHCYRCHGRDGAAEGGFNLVLDRRRLVETGRVLPGKAAKSRLYKRLVTEEMPPEEEKVRPSDEEVAVVKKWIAAGAPDWAAPQQRKFISLEEVARMVRDDRERQKPEAREHLRYLMLTPLYNAGQAEDELQTVRVAMSKLINSLSMGKGIVVPQAIDEARTIFRIDLRDYEISGQLWGLAMGRNPYGLAWRFGPDGPPTELPVRADWFVHAASRPPVYHELGNIPWTARELEGRLKVNIPENLRELRVLRAGFNGSGVSRNNRLIERHDGVHGYYWKSYDFAANIGRQNLFAYPQGPAPGPKTFHHDGGEIIFRLPNGLQGYMLVDDRGNRIDKALNAIVSDPKHPERTVENGISCMSCHTRGLIDKVDQIRPHVQKNLVSFTPAERKSLLALYAPRDKFAAVVRADAEGYQKAVVQTGARVGGTEPIVAASLRFESELDLRQAAAEAWMKPEEFLERLEDFPSLARPLGGLGAEGGTIQRDVFVRYFSLLIARFKIAEPIHPWRGAEQQAPGLFSPPAKEVKPLQGAAFAAGALETPVAGKRLRGHHPVIDPTFRWVAVFDVKSIQVLELASGKAVGEVKQAGVAAIAFSPDGNRLATGGNDARARVWDWKTGELICETPKQRAGFPVFSLAFAPKGDQLLGVGGPREVHLWDVPSGNVRHVLKGNSNTPHRVAFSPDGKTVLACDLAKKSGTLAVWDAASGELRGRERSADTVLLGAVFAPDSKRFVTLGGNATIRLWDTATCDQIGVDRLATNPDNGRFILNNITTALSAGFSADGKYLAIAYEDGAIALCDGATLRDMTVFQAHPPGVLQTVCFSPDGARLASTGTDGSIRFWDVRKLVEAEREGDDR